MIRQLIQSKKKRILIDISTQKDFLLPEGKNCVEEHRKVLANVRRIMAWSRCNRVPTVSISQVYPNNNGVSHPNYCLDGTPGQKKVRYTLMNNRVTYPADSSTSLPLDLFEKYRQIILHERSPNPFDERPIERLLTEIDFDEFILMGATAEGAVKDTALGLLQRRKKVIIISDAVGICDEKEGYLALRKANAKGAKLTTTNKIAGSSHLNIPRLLEHSVHHF